MSKLYICDRTRFKSFLAESIVSFVEYKANVGGCTVDSFLPVMSLFDRHCTNHPEPEICLKQDTVLSFLTIGPGEKNSTAIRKSSIIRSFGRYLAAVLRIKDVYIVPKLVKRGQKTFVPYVFTHDEIARLLHEIENYQPKQEYTKTPNMVNCMSCMFKMLYCTGMRISEVTGLKKQEVDLEQRIIHINQAKNDNKRIVTISDSLAEACNTYLELTKDCKTSNIYFFDTGSVYNDGYVSIQRAYTYFRRFLNGAGIEHKGKGFGPRMHDIRVTFAVHSLQKLSQLPDDINVHLMSLSVFMGHQSIYCTQEYLWLTGELFQNTLEKMEDYTSFVSSIFDEKVGDLDE
jgi:integrase/recombinase XerD